MKIFAKMDSSSLQENTAASANGDDVDELHNLQTIIEENKGEWMNFFVGYGYFGSWVL